VTALAVLVVAGFVAFYGWLHITGDRLDGVEEPERALLLVVGRTLDAEVALDRVSPWERRLHRAAGLETGQELNEAIRWFDELSGASLDPRVDIALAVLEGEAGQRDQVRRTIAEWVDRAEPLPSMAAIVTAAYLAAPTDAATTVAQWSEVAADVPEGWFRDRLAIRLAKAANDPALGRAAEARLAARATPLLTRIRVINVAMVLLVAAGLAAAVLAFRRRRAGLSILRVARAPLPPPWRGRTGFAVVVRAAAVAGLLSVGVSLLTRVVHLDESITDAGLSVLMALPFLVFVSRWLLTPAGLDFRDGFGLSVAHGGAGALVLALTMLIAAGIVIDFGFTVIGDWRGWSAHWTEWFEAPLAWGRPAQVGASLFSLVAGAPVLEELIFRGLIFGTLRRRFSVVLSAVISAGVFALAHGYGTSGTASVFASGVLWAVAYECTGSLLPTMLAHAASNLMTAVVLMVLLR